MLKKSVTFEDYSDPPKEVTRDFYFNYDQLEIMKMLQFEKLEERVKRLTETENNEEAYLLFEKLIVDAYGVREEDGSGFDKKDGELGRKLRNSPALSVIIIEFLNNPSLGAEFIEKCLPPKMVAEAKANIEAEAKKAEASKDENTVELPTAPPVLEESSVVRERDTEVKYEDFTREELLRMSQDDFLNLVGRDPLKMTQDQLVVAMQRRNQQQ